MNIYDHVDIYITLPVGTYICTPNYTVSQKRNLKAGLSLEYPLHDIIRKLSKIYFTDEQNFVNPKLYFFKLKESILANLVERDVIEMSLENTKKLEVLFEIELDFRTFIPILKSRTIFNYHESPLKNPSEVNFWAWKLENQIFTFSKFRDDPWACSVLLISVIAKTNTNCHGEITMDYDKILWGYAFYKIHDHGLVIFGINGCESFLKEQNHKIHNLIGRHRIMVVRLPSDVYHSGIDIWERTSKRYGWSVASPFEKNTKINVRFMGDKMEMDESAKIIENQKGFTKLQTDISKTQNDAIEQYGKTSDLQNKLTKRQNEMIEYLLKLTKNSTLQSLPNEKSTEPLDDTQTNEELIIEP